MGLSYEDIHWGDSPDFTQSMKAFLGPGMVWKQVKAITYSALKGGDEDLWRHVFEVPTHLLVYSAGGSSVNKPPQKTTTLGRVIDFEASSGGKIITSTLWLVTGESGSGAWLASPHEMPVQFDNPEEHKITRRGLETA